MDSRRDCPPRIVALPAPDDVASGSRSLCLVTALLRALALVRPLLIAVGFGIVSTQAQALPLAFGCAPSHPGGSPAECQPVLFRMALGLPVTGSISQEAFVRLIVDTDAISSKFLNSLGGSVSGVLAHAAGQHRIQFSLTRQDHETGVVARLQYEPLGSSTDEMTLHGGSAEALTEQFPFPPAAAFLLVSSGLALTTRQRRRSPMMDEQAVCALQKEVSSAASRTRLYRSTQRMCHADPLRI
jgi:hypothetical protein